VNVSCKTKFILKKAEKLESVSGAPIILSSAAAAVARRQICVGGGGVETYRWRRGRRGSDL